MNISRLGVAIIIATLVAYAIASLERSQAVRDEGDRLTLEFNAEPLGDRKEANRRAEWEAGRHKAAFEEWQKAIETGTAADVQRANKYGERVDEEIKEQNRAWAAADEKNRESRKTAKKEQHTNALAAIERNFYTHFGLIWLAITGVVLALGGWMTSRRGEGTPRPRATSLQEGSLAASADHQNSGVSAPILSAPPQAPTLDHDPAVTISQRQYFFSMGGADSGPHSLHEMRRLRQAGKLSDESMVRREGDKEWQPVWAFSEICFDG